MIIPSDTTVITLNQQIETAIRAYVPTGIELDFNLPTADATPMTPTVNIFLYSLEEDLGLRSSVVRNYSPATGNLGAAYVNIRCGYLITYWDSSNTTQPSAANSQSMQVMNCVLNALINTREISGLPGAYTRVISPSELHGLSIFWQALGNKPRLCLNYSATVPVQLTSLNEQYPAVATLDTSFDNINK
ncbi:hypothetical protein J3D48_006210 [Pseudomonas fluorescens]|uniref:Pvc16 family protein n=1 Tax=Pseudomonas fluorescens TaxID=294 RepID=UPI00209E7A03|nr:Pvc16 family protein [Pseudomonas fluorescens]MCP1489800.1 hypothetical protein [Pseudomonas fluorescens]